MGLPLGLHRAIRQPLKIARACSAADAARREADTGINMLFATRRARTRCHFLRLNAHTSDDKLPMSVASASSSGGSSTIIRISCKVHYVPTLFRVRQGFVSS
jgi:hypothetical protein